MRLWPFLQTHAQPSSGARCLIFGQTLRILPFFMCANSKGSGSAEPLLVAYVISTKISWAGSILWLVDLSILINWISSLIIWAPSSEFVSLSIPSWQIVTAHAQPFRGAKDLAFCLKVPLDSLLVWASSGGSGETARMHRLAWTFAARIGDKYQIRLTQSI